MGAMGSRVIVERKVGVNSGRGVSVLSGALANAVAVGSAVLMTNRSGVLEASNVNGVAVGTGEPGGVCN